MNTQLSFTRIRRVVLIVLAIIGIILLLSFAGRFFYFLKSVQEQEVGIQFRNNRLQQVVGPGVYSDVGIASHEGK